MNPWDAAERFDGTTQVSEKFWKGIMSGCVITCVLMALVVLVYWIV